MQRVVAKICQTVTGAIVSLGQLFSCGFIPESYSQEVFRDTTFNYGAADDVQFSELDPNTKRKFEGRQSWAINKPRHVPRLVKLDLEKALSAELSVEYWGGHIGTSQQQFQINGHGWQDIPQPVGTPTEPQRFYRTLLGNNRVPISLDHLNAGENIVQFGAGKQIAYSFDFGLYWIYDFTIRVNYTAERPHPTGSVGTVDGSQTFEENIQLEVKNPHSPNGSIARVDFIGEYEDFDWDGDGVWREYQFTTHHGKLRNHLGTANSAPWQVNFDATWLPNQSAPIQVRAIITDEHGVSSMTPPVELLQRRTKRLVTMVKPSVVAERCSARDGKESPACQIDFSGDRSKLRSAKLLLSSWSGNVDDDSQHELRWNGAKLAERFGVFHNYDFDYLDIPVDLIKDGPNQVTVFSTYLGHGFEINWPGPVLILEYEHPLAVRQSCRDFPAVSISQP
jgi:hypothetical protein